MPKAFSGIAGNFATYQPFLSLSQSYSMAPSKKVLAIHIKSKTD
jgi:hypothetical protein